MYKNRNLFVAEMESVFSALAINTYIDLMFELT